MFTMTVIDNIRDMFFVKGMKISEIIDETGFNRRTIKKYIEKDDWNEDDDKLLRKSKLDPFKTTIDNWLENDKYQKKKQRHTATRIFNRLQQDKSISFDCSYKTVANYVSKTRIEIYKKDVGYLPLDHIPGEAQVDFGEADFIENGTRYTGKYLAMTFPHSNAGYYQLFFGETYECLAEGMKAIFEYIGGVPTKIWFDNASSMVARVEKEGHRKLTDSFLKFKNHYRFEAVFCNTAAGNEKGSVENKVGYFRRNFMVPIPEFKNIVDYNKQVFEDCNKDMVRLHYEKKVLISELHKTDKEQLLDLPVTALDIVNITKARVNKYGKITLNNGKHTYSTEPRLAGSFVTVCHRAFTITILDTDLKEIVKHRRMYGNTNKESMDWIPYLEQLSKRPTALKYSGIYKMLPGNIQNYMDVLGRNEKGDVLKALVKITKKSDFTTGIKILVQAQTMNIADTDSILSLFNSKNYDFNELKYIEPSDKVPFLEPISTRKDKYDLMLKSGVHV